jgi:hypothetical protein
LCILCSVAVLSKMLKLRSAEGSSFRLWWMLSAIVAEASVFLLNAVSRLLLKQHLLDAVSLLLLRQHHGECCQPFVAEAALLCSSSDSVIVGICWTRVGNRIFLTMLSVLR